VADPIWENTGGAGYLSVPDASDLRITGDLTIEFFAGWQRTTPRTEFIVSKHWTAEYHVEVASNGTLRFCHGTSVGPAFTCVDSASGYVPNDTIVHHYAIVRDAVSSPKRILFYKDGVLTNTFTYTQSVTTSTNNLVIGSNPTSLSGNEFDGYIDEVAVYNYQVPGDRIALHYASALNRSISKFTIGPTLCGNVRTGTAAFDVAERWCLGNLAGTYGYNSTASVYGFASGNPSATWVSVDATNGFRILNGSSIKLSADTSGNLFLLGDLEVGTAGAFYSGSKLSCTGGTGIWMAYNSGNPQACFGDADDYLHWDGSVLSLKSKELTIDDDGILLNARTTDSFNFGHSYAFRSSFTNYNIGMWAYELDAATDNLDLRLQATTTRSNTTTRIHMLTSDEDNDIAAITLNTGTAAASDSNINFSAARITVDLTHTGFSGTKVAGSCTFTIYKGFITNVTGC